MSAANPAFVSMVVGWEYTKIKTINIVYVIREESHPSSLVTGIQNKSSARFEDPLGGTEKQIKQKKWTDFSVAHERLEVYLL